MTQGKQQLKFERNLHKGFKDNCNKDYVWTDEWWMTDDGQILISPCWQESSTAKNRTNLLKINIKLTLI